MISNLPVIATKIGGIPYQINQDCGILIEPNSPRDLANAIERLIDKPEDILKMGNNSKKRVLENFRGINLLLLLCMSTLIFCLIYKSIFVANFFIFNFFQLTP